MFLLIHKVHFDSYSNELWCENNLLQVTSRGRAGWEALLIAPLEDGQGISLYSIPLHFIPYYSTRFYSTLSPSFPFHSTPLHSILHSILLHSIPFIPFCSISFCSLWHLESNKRIWGSPSPPYQGCVEETLIQVMSLSEVQGGDLYVTGHRELGEDHPRTGGSGLRQKC